MNKLKYSHFNIFEYSLILLGTGLVWLGIHLGKNLSDIELINLDLEIIGSSNVGIAKRKTERSFSWKSLTIEDQIYNNDQIFTNAHQNLDIELKNKAHVIIKPNSLIRIYVDQRSQINLDIGQGNVELATIESTQPLKLKHSDTLIQVNGGSLVRVEKIDDFLYGIKLKDGSAKLLRKVDKNFVKTSLVINKPELISYDRNNLKNDIIKTKHLPLLKSNEINILESETIDLEMKYFDVNKKIAYLKFIQESNNNKNEIFKLDIVNNKINTRSLSLGKFIISPTDDFKIIDSFDVVSTDENIIKVNKTEIDYEESFDITLKLRDGIKTRVIVEYPKLSKKKEFITYENKLKVPSLNQEKIKVTAIPHLNDSSITYKKNIDLKISNPYEVEQIKTIALVDKVLTTIKINRPLYKNNHVIKLTNRRDNSKAILSLKKDNVFEGYDLKSGEYRVEIFNDNDDSIFLSEDFEVPKVIFIKEESVESQTDLIVQKFHWSLPNVENDSSVDKLRFLVEILDKENNLVLKKRTYLNNIEFKSDKTNIYKIRVSILSSGKPVFLGEKVFKLRPPVSLQPKKIEQRIMKYDAKKLCYEVRLPHYSTASKYFIEIYRDAKIKRIVREVWSDGPLFCWRTSRDGKYFLRYKYIDYWGNASSYSGVSEIIFPISPLTDF